MENNSNGKLFIAFFQIYSIEFVREIEFEKK